MSKPVYPNVRCVKPGHKDEPGYIVCEHILDGAVVAHCALATPKRLGELLCAACITSHPSAKTLHAVCAHCAHNQAWVNMADSIQ